MIATKLRKVVFSFFPFFRCRIFCMISVTRQLAYQHIRPLWLLQHIETWFIYAAMSLPCPFGEDPVDLSSETLTDDHKKWFAQQLLENVDSKASLAQKYNLKPHTLPKWKDCVRKGIPFPGKMGRPPLWDNDALEILSKCIDDREYKIRSTDFLQQAQICRQETSKKRNRDDSDSLLPSKRTVKHLDS